MEFFKFDLFSFLEKHRGLSSSISLFSAVCLYNFHEELDVYLKVTLYLLLSFGFYALCSWLWGFIEYIQNRKLLGKLTETEKSAMLNVKHGYYGKTDVKETFEKLTTLGYVNSKHAPHMIKLTTQGRYLALLIEQENRDKS